MEFSKEESQEEERSRNHRSGKFFGKVYLEKWNYVGISRAINSATLAGRYESCMGYTEALGDWIDTYQNISFNELISKLQR